MTAKQQIQLEIETKIKKRIGAAAIGSDEIIKSLAYACTFKNPRNFRGVYMTPERWDELANTLTHIELLNVVNSLERFKDGNRLFYILGGLAIVYGKRTSCIPKSDAFDYPQRRYTNAELSKNVITSIEQMKNIDW